MIKGIIFASILTAFALVLTPGASAQGNVAAQGNAIEGKRVAETWCGGCHLTGKEPGAKQAAPSFASIANNRLLSTDYLDAWVRNPKPPMHVFQLTPEMIADLVAYMRTLEK